MERIARPGRPWRSGKASGEWRYIVKGPGLAIELLAAWDAREGVWRAVTGGRHELLCVPMPGDEVADPDCELVGGACEFVGLPLQLEEAMASLGDPRRPGTERPEAFWAELERLVLSSAPRRGADPRIRSLS